MVISAVEVSLLQHLKLGLHLNSAFMTRPVQALRMVNSSVELLMLENAGSNKIQV